jgi:acyl-CoA thioester hydrolase
MTESDIDPPVMRTDRVRFAETDLQGVVFYGQFFTYTDEAFNAFLREIDYRYERMGAEGWTTHVVHADLDYHATARFEDVIESHLGITEVEETSFTAAFEAREETTGDLLASGSVVHVAADSETGDAIDVPEAFREAIEAHRTEALS